MNKLQMNQRHQLLELENQALRQVLAAVLVEANLSRLIFLPKYLDELKGHTECDIRVGKKHLTAEELGIHAEVGSAPEQIAKAIVIELRSVKARLQEVPPLPPPPPPPLESSSRGKILFCRCGSVLSEGHVCTQ